MKFNDYNKVKPKEGELVIWVWADAGQVTAGDYYNGKARDANRNYAVITRQDILPTHWIKWPSNWP